MQPTLANPPALMAALPFAGLLASIALLPNLAPRLWHRRMAEIAAGWTLSLLLPIAMLQGFAVSGHMLLHAVLLEYLPFLLLLLALYTAAGGILIQGGPWGRPGGNTALLALGTALAGVMGTTGVAMVLIQPFLRANAHRHRKTHLVVFFIVLVANAGGATTPLGDPPLYLGFLHGVPFIWPLERLSLPLLSLAVPLLLAFYLIDKRLEDEPPPGVPIPLRVHGWANVALVGLVVATVVAQGVWHPGAWDLLGIHLEIERALAMLVFAGIAAASLRLTPPGIRAANRFGWEPMREVLILFGGIFVTIVPVMEILAAGSAGPAAGLVALATDRAGNPAPLAYFWLTGVLSAFLDNAPTYLIFFQMAGNDPAALTGRLATVLQAMSAGAVFFGALTYIGNAPNMMVRAIAVERGIRMPGFFGYMGWAAALLLPVFLLQSLLFFL